MSAGLPMAGPMVHCFSAEADDSTGGPACATSCHTQASACHSGRWPVAAVSRTTSDLTWDTCSYSGRWVGLGMTIVVTPHPSRADLTSATCFKSGLERLEEME